MVRKKEWEDKQKKMVRSIMATSRTMNFMEKALRDCLMEVTMKANGEKV